MIFEVILHLIKELCLFSVGIDIKRPNYCVEPHISIYFTDIKYFFQFGQPGACPMTSSLTTFSAYTSNSGAGRPGAGSRLSKLKTDLTKSSVSTSKNGFTDS